VKALPKATDGSYEESVLAEGQEYTVGTNDGCQFRNVIYKGTKNYNGKQIMVFTTQNKQQLTINPSYHSFTLENPEVLYLNGNTQSTEE